MCVDRCCRLCSLRDVQFVYDTNLWDERSAKMCCRTSCVSFFRSPSWLWVLLSKSFVWGVDDVMCPDVSWIDRGHRTDTIIKVSNKGTVTWRERRCTPTKRTHLLVSASLMKLKVDCVGTYDEDGRCNLNECNTSCHNKGDLCWSLSRMWCCDANESGPPSWWLAFRPNGNANQFCVEVGYAIRDCD